MSPVVLQLFPTLAPHLAGCISPLTNKESLIREEYLKLDAIKHWHICTPDPILTYTPIII